MTFENDATEVFSGFFAVSEKCRDQRKWYYGFLYLPGIELQAKLG
ncbi:hypothetical protein [Sporocytophaga myxococcoides]|nr:hypothetical protein [Sporocytophaga myxococcoides]